MTRFMEIVGEKLGDVYGERGLGGLYGMGVESGIGKRFSKFRRDYAYLFELPWFADLMVGVNVMYMVLIWIVMGFGKLFVNLPYFRDRFGTIQVCTFGGLFCTQRDAFWIYDFFMSISSERCFMLLAGATVGCFFGSVRLPDARKRSAFVTMVLVGSGSWLFSDFGVFSYVCYIGEIYSAVLAVLIAKEISVGFSLFYFWFLLKLVLGFPVPGFVVVWFFTQVSLETVVEESKVSEDGEVVVVDQEMDEVFIRVVGVDRPKALDVRSVWKVDPQDKDKFDRVKRLALKGDRFLKYSLSKYAINRGSSTAQYSDLEAELQSDDAMQRHALIADPSWIALPPRFKGKALATTVEAVIGLWSDMFEVSDFRSVEMFERFSQKVAMSNGKVLKGIVLENSDVCSMERLE